MSYYDRVKSVRAYGVRSPGHLQRLSKPPLGGLGVKFFEDVETTAFYYRDIVRSGKVKKVYKK